MDWQPIDTAPIKGPFLVCDGRRMMVADGHMLSLSLLPETPQHLSGHHWTHWMPLPPLPVVPKLEKRRRYLARRAVRRAETPRQEPPE